MPYTKIEDAPANIRELDGVKLTLPQINEIAEIADALNPDEVENVWAVAITTWKKGHEIKDGEWVKKSEHQHPHGEHECKCSECGAVISVEAGVKCSAQKCPECGAAMVAVEPGERRGMASKLSLDASKFSLEQAAYLSDALNMGDVQPVKRDGKIYFYAKPELEQAHDVLGVEIFEAGEWTDGNGKKFKWTIDTLKEIATNSRKDGGIPVRLGHDVKSGDPAFGWVENLRVVGQKLIGDLMRVPAEIYKYLNTRYRKRSAGFANRNNKWELDHLALLGAEQAALDGLKDIFSYS